MTENYTVVMTHFDIIRPIYYSGEARNIGRIILFIAVMTINIVAISIIINTVLFSVPFGIDWWGNDILRQYSFLFSIVVHSRTSINLLEMVWHEDIIVWMYSGWLVLLFVLLINVIHTYC